MPCFRFMPCDGLESCGLQTGSVNGVRDSCNDRLRRHTARQPAGRNLPSAHYCHDCAFGNRLRRVWQPFRPFAAPGSAPMRPRHPPSIEPPSCRFTPGRLRLQHGDERARFQAFPRRCGQDCNKAPASKSWWAGLSRSQGETVPPPRQQALAPHLSGLAPHALELLCEQVAMPHRGRKARSSD